MARLDLAWDARLALPAADLAIVGTMAWLREDLDAYIVREGDDLPSSSIGAILMPKMERVATWFTRLYASARLSDCLPLPQELSAVILDGNGAIRYLAEIEAPVVICVFDRSVADETAAELVIQLRNTPRRAFVRVRRSEVDATYWHRGDGIFGGTVTRIGMLNERYAASATLVRRGAQIVAVGDPVGARFNAAVRRLMIALRDDGPGPWDDLVGASKALRWRLITQPQPIVSNPGLRPPGL